MRACRVGQECLGGRSVMALTPYLYVDGLSWIVAGLAGVVGLVTLAFGARHLTSRPVRIRFLAGGLSALLALTLLSAADAIMVFALSTRMAP